MRNLSFSEVWNLPVKNTKMKNIILNGFTCFALLIFFNSCASSSVTSQTITNPPVTYQLFYDDLSPYGTWIDYPGYGHVWNPGLSGDFRPYATNGHWVSSVEGWAWASDYNWGWAPFHYGRWLYDDMYGWLWIPGYDWSPAWVTWGSVDNLYCWAPLMPGINVSLQYGSWKPHSYYWNACSRNHIYDKNLAAVLENASTISPFVNRISIMNNFNTTKKNNLYYSSGPNVHEVEKYANRKIDAVSIKDVHQINQVKHADKIMNVYRPEVEDPKETLRKDPQKTLGPNEFRRTDISQSKPIRDEVQQPIIKRSEQRNNIETLPVFHSGAGSFQNKNQGRRPTR